MDKVDQFESVFRSATKELFHYGILPIRTVLIVTDLCGSPAERFAAKVRALMATVRNGDECSFVTIDGERFTSAKDLLDLVEAQRPDLIASYRCLHSEAWRWAFTLGAHIDVLTQSTTTPVLLMPHPDDSGEAAGSESTVKTDRVMAVTDHLTGDEHLVNAALAFTEPSGTLFLTHVEDDATFERYLGVVGRIPEIDTEFARELIETQLLKEPHDYIRSVSAALRLANVACTIEELVSMGSHVKEYKALVEANQVDLLVLNTKDEDQSAMHGLAYPLAVELRDTPLLML